MFLSTLRQHEQSPSDEIPEASCTHPSQAHVEKSEQVRCSLYRRLYSIRAQLVHVSLLAQDEYKQAKTLQTLVVEHSTIEKKITKTIFTAGKTALT